jgi:hypothetical protein
VVSISKDGELSRDIVSDCFDFDVLEFDVEFEKILAVAEVAP